MRFIESKWIFEQNTLKSKLKNGLFQFTLDTVVAYFIQILEL